MHLIMRHFLVFCGYLCDANLITVAPKKRPIARQYQLNQGSPFADILVLRGKRTLWQLDCRQTLRAC